MAHSPLHLVLDSGFVVRLTLEALGHTLTVTLEQPAPKPEPPQPGGDVYAAVERRDSHDHSPRPIGFRRERRTDE